MQRPYYNPRRRLKVAAVLAAYGGAIITTISAIGLYAHIHVSAAVAGLSAAGLGIGVVSAMAGVAYACASRRPWERFLLREARNAGWLRLNDLGVEQAQQQAVSMYVAPAQQQNLQPPVQPQVPPAPERAVLYGGEIAERSNANTMESREHAPCPRDPRPQLEKKKQRAATMQRGISL